ncbi:uncharacterized protein LOC124935772 [Impatiens glandulifera]|uniref:uncharacterized protein LOC124935772 n=1 Tax=Impatiens glandulifera TaxID=253017 RepID=UPI001FB081A4|nr:uncharacterized protein LOC124935772 [Impatiens glandulifera]
MISHPYATDSHAKSTELASTVSTARSPAEIASSCAAIEDFLHNHTAEQDRWFFSITFPTLICKLFGFDGIPAQRSQPSTSWIDIASNTDVSELKTRLFNLLSPNGILMSSISSVDRLSLVKYVFPSERLPEWVRFMFQNERDCCALVDLCPLFKGMLKGDSIKGVPNQVHLNVFEYYMFWFAYYPVCKGNTDGYDAVKVEKNMKFRLENWKNSIPSFSAHKRTSEKKDECSLYLRLLYAYLRSFVPLSDLNSFQPYRNSLLQYSHVPDNSVLGRAEFVVNTLIQFWLVDNDFSPVPVSVCQSLGVSFPFRSVLGETPPTSGLGELVKLVVKYLSTSLVLSNGHDPVQSSGSPRWKISGSAHSLKSVNAVPMATGLQSPGCWNTLIGRPLYRFILRTFLFCPVETSIKKASQVFQIWTCYMEPWMIMAEDFAQLEEGASEKLSENTIIQSSSRVYSSSWQNFVLSNYLYYSSLVMHFIGFAHKFLHADPEVIVQMVSKVLDILTSSRELTDLINNMDTAFHSKPCGSSKSMVSSLYRYVPMIREQLKDWEDGLCENDADGSFLHENWNKDLRLFSDAEDGGKQLLQLFIMRAELELQAISGNNLTANLQSLNSVKAKLVVIFGNSLIEPITPTNTPKPKPNEPSRSEIFKPKQKIGNCFSPDIKYKGDWMNRPVSDDEVAWMAKILVDLSGWMNGILGLNGNPSPRCQFVDVSEKKNNVVCGAGETMKVMVSSLICCLFGLFGLVGEFMRKHNLRVNLRVLASKKVFTVLVVFGVFCLLRRAFAAIM